MKTPQWKQKPYERERRDLAHRYKELEERCESLMRDRDHVYAQVKAIMQEFGEAKELAKRYNALREKEIVVMDGEAKYLTGKTLDEYCDEQAEKKFAWFISTYGQNLAASMAATKREVTMTAEKIFVSATQVQIMKRLWEEK